MKRILDILKGHQESEGCPLSSGRFRLSGGLPRVLLLVACAAALPALVGCVAYVHGGFPIVVGRPSPYYYDYDAYYHPRPHSSYYCYDCHGYSYFDPYYDYCMHFGFRIDWGHHTPLWRYYNRHHDTIVRKIGYPRYRYKYDYREGPRYRSPLSYEKWKRTDGRTYFTTKTKVKSTDTKKSTDVKKSTTSKSTKTKKATTTTTNKTTTKTKSSGSKK